MTASELAKATEKERVNRKVEKRRNKIQKTYFAIMNVRDFTGKLIEHGTSIPVRRVVQNELNISYERLRTATNERMGNYKPNLLWGRFGEWSKIR